MVKIARKKSEGRQRRGKRGKDEAEEGRVGQGENPPSLISHFSLKFSKKFKNFSKFPSKLNQKLKILRNIFSIFQNVLFLRFFSLRQPTSAGGVQDSKDFTFLSTYKL